MIASVARAAEFWERPDVIEILTGATAKPAGDKRGYKHCRLELPHASYSVIQRALTLRAPCCSCGRLITPFRIRRAPSGRGRAPGNCYIAVACEMESGSLGCSRGRAAAEIYDLLERLIRESKPEHDAPHQGNLL